ncbi:hypothetical protein ISR94_01670 [Candidatus Microgenomates bacterium]|nr:hypothetical protein [Candidatus Microgenomates bacterium]
MESSTQEINTPRPDQVMDYDAILSTRRELTPENLTSIGDLIDVSMEILQEEGTDKKTGFRTAYLMTRKITSSNFFNKKSVAGGNRFYVMIRDLKAGNEFANKIDGLIIHCKKVGHNLEPISEEQWSLPRSRQFTKNDRYLSSVSGKDEDWKLIDELTNDLKVNKKVYKKAINIEKDLFDKRTR